MGNKKTIAVCGLGYVGLPLAMRFAECNCKVIGIDIDIAKVQFLNQHQSYIQHVKTSLLKSLAAEGLFTAYDDFSKIKDAEAIIICVPTPLGKNRNPDLSYVIETGKRIAPYIKRREGGKKKLVVLESTTYPGTTNTELKEVLENVSGLKAGIDFHLAYSPEREDPGRKNYSVKDITKIVSGLTTDCLERCKELYSIAVNKVHKVSTLEVAEATKLTENIFRSVNIALVNELKIVYRSMGIDIWEVIDAASTKPFGYMPFFPGPGLGGHCIPIDPFYLTWKAKEFDQHSRFVELAGEVNTKMPDYVVANVINALNEKQLATMNSKIFVIGLAYKADVDDDRESPSYTIISKLQSLGAHVSFHDPFIPKIKTVRKFKDLCGKKSIPLTPSNIAKFDCVLVLTKHADLDYKMIYRHSKIIVDTRNSFNKIKDTKNKIHKS